MIDINLHGHQPINQCPIIKRCKDFQCTSKIRCLLQLRNLHTQGRTSCTRQQVVQLHNSGFYYRRLFPLCSTWLHLTNHTEAQLLQSFLHDCSISNLIKYVCILDMKHNFKQDMVQFTENSITATIRWNTQTYLLLFRKYFFFLCLALKAWP